VTELVLPSGGIPWLTIVLILPLVGVGIVLLAHESLSRPIGLAVSVLTLLVSLPLWFVFDNTQSGMHFVEKHQWIDSPAIHYSLGVDGISMPLVLLTTFLTPLCVLISWTSIQTRMKEFLISLLVMETATIGVFSAFDFVLFYVFWETMLIPMYLLIGVWGGQNRVYAAIKFFLYTLAGSVLLLVAILVLYFEGGRTFDILALTHASYAPSLQALLFWAFFAAFAVKVPMFPFHTWLPDAHVEAPTAGSVILASVLLKMAPMDFYGFPYPCCPMRRWRIPLSS
jgi:NADH-quinone oxidoreductase subunit M